MTRRSVFAGLLLLLAAVLMSTARAQQPSAEYRLGAGDGIRISVFQNPDLMLETRVGGDGTITYPLIGQVKIGGETIAAAERTIARGLEAGHYIKHPQVTIVVTQILSHQVSVLGEVGKPGRFPLDTFNTRLSTVIAMAGGITPAGGEAAVVTGERDGKPFRRVVNIPAIFTHRGSADDMVISGGDTVYVPRAPTFYIYGEVQRPGAYRLEPGMTMRDALAQGGGLTPRGSEKDLRVYRRDAKGKVIELTPKLDDTVRPRDVLRVGESLF